MGDLLWSDFEAWSSTMRTVLIGTDAVFSSLGLWGILEP